MTVSETYRRKADKLLSEAAAAPNMADRGRLIDEALRWHVMAMDAAGHPERRLYDDGDPDLLDTDMASDAAG